jgi:3',5'-cyclic AMP phosphodiesterase CpdA
VLAVLALVTGAGCAYVDFEPETGALLPTAIPSASAAPRVPESFSFIHMADPQLFWGADALDRWKGAIATANRLRPDFVVVGGDLLNAHGDPAKRDAAETGRMVAAYLDAAKALDPAVPLYNVAGNHDVGNTPTPEAYAWYEERFGKPWYSFEHKGGLFVVLESNVLKNPERLPGVAEIVFMHHPFCLKSIDEKEAYENLPKDIRARLLALFKETGVEAVFSGHFHGNRRVDVEGIDCVVTNAVAKSLRGGPPGFRIVKVTPDGIEHAFHSWDDAPERLP